jgi:hypothetical protein
MLHCTRLCGIFHRVSGNCGNDGQGGIDVTEDRPRRTGLRLRPSYCERLNSLAPLRKRTATDLLNEAVQQWLDKQPECQPPRKRRARQSA